MHWWGATVLICEVFDSDRWQGTNRAFQSHACSRVGTRTTFAQETRGFPHCDGCFFKGKDSRTWRMHLWKWRRLMRFQWVSEARSAREHEIFLHKGDVVLLAVIKNPWYGQTVFALCVDSRHMQPWRNTRNAPWKWSNIWLRSGLLVQKNTDRSSQKPQRGWCFSSEGSDAPCSVVIALIPPSRQMREVFVCAPVCVSALVCARARAWTPWNVYNIYMRFEGAEIEPLSNPLMILSSLPPTSPPPAPTF